MNDIPQPPDDPEAIGRPEDEELIDRSMESEGDTDPFADRNFIWDDTDGDSWLNTAYLLDKQVTAAVSSFRHAEGLEEHGLDLTNTEYGLTLYLDQRGIGAVAMAIGVVGFFVQDEAVRASLRQVGRDLQRLTDEGRANLSAEAKEALETAHEAYHQAEGRKALLEMGFSEEEVEAMLSGASDDAPTTDASQN